MIAALTVPIPARMAHLKLDHRGYPIFHVIQIDRHGKPLFIANDTQKQRQCIYKRLCAICGQTLDAGYWFAGGPGSALHKHGCYLDSAMHRECMRYALQVCPYLILRNYQPPDSSVIIPHLEKRLPDSQLMFDPTVDMNTPKVFLAVMARWFSIEERNLFESPYLRPQRPYVACEFWKEGQELPFTEGLALIRPIPELDLRALRLLMVNQ